MKILKAYLKMVLYTFGALIVGFLLFAIWKGAIQPRINTIGVCSGADSCLYTMLNGRDSVNVLGFVDGDRRFLTSGGSGTLIHDAASGEKIGDVNPSFSKFFTRISPDGTQIAAINREFAEVEIFNTAGEELFYMMVNPEFKIRDFVFLPLVKGFAFSRTDHAIMVMHFPNAERITEIPNSEGAGELSSSADGEYMAAVKFAEQAIYIWPIRDIDRPQTIDGIEVAATAKVVLSHDGSRIAITANEGVFVWNRADLEQVAFITREESKARRFSLTPDGKQIAVAFDDGWVEIWALDSGELLHAVEHSQQPGTVALSTDGTLLAVGLYDDAIVKRYTEAELRAIERRNGGSSTFLSANTNYVESTPGYGVVWGISNEKK